MWNITFVLTYSRQAIDILSKKVQLLDRSITDFLSATITERLASYLLQVNNNGKLNVTVKNCADSIGGSYRHTNRVFSLFVEEGALKKSMVSISLLIQIFY